jgi:hypothetical protein
MGLCLSLFPGSGHREAVEGSSEPEKPSEYTLVLKTGIPPLRTDGRRESTINYEYTFPYPGKSSGLSQSKHSITWDKFVETYRGRPIKKGDEGYEPLDPARGISEISFMCRSGFGRQEGPFELLVQSLETIPSTQELASAVSEYRNEENTGRVTEDKKDAPQSQAYYVPVEDQTEEDKTWMRVALDMVSRVTRLHIASDNTPSPCRSF